MGRQAAWAGCTSTLVLSLACERTMLPCAPHPSILIKDSPPATTAAEGEREPGRPGVTDECRLPLRAAAAAAAASCSARRLSSSSAAATDRMNSLQGRAGQEARGIHRSRVSKAVATCGLASTDAGARTEPPIPAWRHTCKLDLARCPSQPHMRTHLLSSASAPISFLRR